MATREQATPQDKAQPKQDQAEQQDQEQAERASGAGQTQLERLATEEAERLQQAREQASDEGRTQVLGVTYQPGEDPENPSGPIILSQLEEEEKGALLGGAQEAEEQRDAEKYATLEQDRRNVASTTAPSEVPDRPDLTLTTTFLTVKPPEVPPNQNPGMHEVDPPPHQVRDADDGAWVFEADEPFYEEDPMTEEGLQEVEKRMRERMGQVEGRDEVRELGPSQSVPEGWEVESPSETIRVNQTLENVTIGYGTNYNFTQGRKYKVPKNVATVLREKGYVND